ncbi:MAG TPA: 2-oxoglutarate and iron-dependent oxygenase domain-containing protein [Acidimicrobiales bacterium]|nr:2-oxoglutarate and iron-dependent oxygenase domain-containing protein [Acidimicrobiales bacterium]
MTEPQVGDLPVIDVGPLRSGSGHDERAACAAAIDAACRSHGFFYVVGHGVDPSLQARLDRLAREFFALPDAEKSAIAMAKAGRAWRGWFPVGGELTSGRPDRKEGIYLGAELPPSHPRVATGVPLHGANLFPDRPADLGPIVLAYLEAMTGLGHALARGLALALGHDAGWFERTLTGDPLVLFRIFHYPPDPAPDEWGVGEHTDYGLLTLLLQDGNGGLEVRGPDGWVSAPPVPDSFVCNLGDMLERMTDGRYRSTPHRVRNTSGTSRLSFPFFFDPGWDAVVPGVAGTYGDYVLSKVSKVFPDLHADAVGEAGQDQA